MSKYVSLFGGILVVVSMFFVLPKIAEAKCTWNCSRDDLTRQSSGMRAVFTGSTYSVNVSTYYGNVSAYYQGWYQSNGTYYPIGSGGDTTNNNGGGGGGGGCDPNSWGGCSVSCGGGVMYNGCGGSQSCNTQACCDANNWGAGWSACTGTQATQSRTNACGTVESADCPSVSGRIYYDPYHTCATDDPSSLGMMLSVTYAGSIKGKVAVNGTYSILTGPAGNGSLQLDGLNGNYECSTCNPQGCTFVTNTASPSISNNFFIADRPNPWWQAKGAGIYVGSDAGGTTLLSNIPRYVPVAERYLILPGGTMGVAALMRASGSADYGKGAVNDSKIAAITKYQGKKMDYQWFVSQIGLTLKQTNDWAADTMNQPANDPAKVFYYISPASGTATITSPWHVLSKEKYIILVNGDLKIDQNITVDEGGFVAFIVKNGVKVATGVTKLEGLYEMDGMFETLTTGDENDVALVTGGSVVAWGGVSLNRNIGKTNNASTPSEQFVYRQDLLTNMPKEMKTFLMSWAEVPAGTFQ